MASGTPIFTSDWFSGNIPNWQSTFKRQNWDPNTPKEAIEIGSYEGRFTLWILENLLKHKDSKLHCIDVFPNKSDPTSYYNTFKHNIVNSVHGSKVEVHPEASFSFLKKFIAVGKQVDFIYLDGSHQSVDVLEDLVFCFRALKKGGLLICDDYLGGSVPGRDVLLSSPKLAIDYFAHIYRNYMVILPGLSLYQLTFVKFDERNDDDHTSRGA